MSASVEDYVKAIHHIEARGSGPASTTELAHVLGVSAGSVSAMIRRLAARGVLVHRRYRGVVLTTAGRRVAMSILRRHRVVELHMIGRLGMSDAGAHAEAEILEHHVSSEFRERVVADIVRAGGTCGGLVSVSLSSLMGGDHGLVVGADPPSALVASGLQTGEYVQAIGRADRRRPLRLHSTLGVRLAPEELATCVRVIPG